MQTSLNFWFLFRQCFPWAALKGSGFQTTHRLQQSQFGPHIARDADFFPVLAWCENVSKWISCSILWHINASYGEIAPTSLATLHQKHFMPDTFQKHSKTIKNQGWEFRAVSQQVAHHICQGSGSVPKILVQTSHRSLVQQFEEKPVASSILKCSKQPVSNMAESFPARQTSAPFFFRMFVMFCH